MKRIPRIFDVRAGEGRVPLLGFAALLLLIITAHTVLETARDAMLLTGAGPRALGLVYICIAACTLPAAALAARAGARFGVRRALAGTLALAASAGVLLFVVPTSRGSAIAVYVVSGVIASVAVPQFWTLVGSVLTLAQGRRLFGLIAAAGVLGGVLGSGTAAVMIQVLPVKTLLLLSAGVFAVAGAALARARGSEPSPRPQPPSSQLSARPLRAFRDNPFLIRLALIVFLSTATLLTLDYYFKSTVARSMPRAQIGPFVARYYLALNVLSLFVQLFVGSAVVRAIGIAAAILVTPFLLFLGAGWAALSGGALAVVLLLKGIDGSLRHSIHRITGELMYLPVPAGVRARVKPLIDGALGRGAQTATGAVLLALGGSSLLSSRPFALLVAGLALAWLFVASTMRGPYLDVLRHAISNGSFDAPLEPYLLDLDGAQILVQHLASEDPLEVVGAMRVLSRRGRQGFVPALVLLHEDESVLVAALDLFAASAPSDWIPQARRLLEDSREPVRMAAARALAMHDELDPTQLANDAGPRVHAYATLHLVLRETSGDVLEDPRIANLLRASGESAGRARLGLLAATADAPSSGRLVPLLLALSDFPPGSLERTELFARAAARQGDRRLIPRLVSLLTFRPGREAVRSALVSLKDPAFDAVQEALSVPTGPRNVRVHAPKTLARFGTRRAAECLLRAIETEGDGLVRYKAIRALGLLAAGRQVQVDHKRAERLCQVDLVEHFRILGLRAALDPPLGKGPTVAPSTAEPLLLGLLGDKVGQSLDRAFRLLKIAHPREDIHGVHLACRSGDAYARANAGEFLDALLRRRSQLPIRALFRIVADDLPAGERVSRAVGLGAAPEVPSQESALTALLGAWDLTLAALAGIVALEIGTPALRAAVDDARRRRPEIDVSVNRLLYNFGPVQRQETARA